MLLWSRSPRFSMDQTFKDSRVSIWHWSNSWLCILRSSLSSKTSTICSAEVTRTIKKLCPMYRIIIWPRSLQENAQFPTKVEITKREDVSLTLSTLSRWTSKCITTLMSSWESSEWESWLMKFKLKLQTRVLAKEKKSKMPQPITTVVTRTTRMMRPKRSKVFMQLSSVQTVWRSRETTLMSWTTSSFSLFANPSLISRNSLLSSEPTATSLVRISLKKLLRRERSIGRFRPLIPSRIKLKSIPTSSREISESRLRSLLAHPQRTLTPKTSETTKQLNLQKVWMKKAKPTQWKETKRRLKSRWLRKIPLLRLKSPRKKT